MWPQIAVLLAALIAAPACNDRTREPPEVEFEPDNLRTNDAGDTGVEDTGPPPDELCAGRSDGASCALVNARGICFQQNCRFVACESGWGDCDTDPGCETDLTAESDCGACGNRCDAAASCIRSPEGATCSEGIVCPTDRFDLDSDPANGCEWAATWESPRTLVPGDLAIEASSWDGVPVVAGRSQGSRISTRLADTPEPTVWETPQNMAARAVAVDYSEFAHRVLWSDGLSTADPTEASQAFLQLQCAEASSPRRYVGLADPFAATQFELARIDECDDEPCLRAVFGTAEYLRAFWPYATEVDSPDVADPTWQFAPEEVTECTADCLFSDVGEFVIPPGCAGARQCRDAAFDDAACGSCGVDSGCPDFRIVDVAATADRVFVVTARGLVVLSAEDLSPLARIEAPFDSETSGGPRFVGARVTSSDQGTEVTMLHSTGFARSLRIVMGDEVVTVEPLAPDVGTDADLEASSVAANRRVLAIVSGEQVRLVAPGEVSARTAFLTMESAPGVQGLSPVQTVVAPEGFRVFYVAVGQLFSRLIWRTSDR